MLSTISTDAGMQFGRSARGVERIDNIFRMQPLGIGNALLLIDAGENHAIGEAQAFHQLVFEHLAAQRVGARFEHGPESRVRDRRSAARAAFREWPWDDARSRR